MLYEVITTHVAGKNAVELRKFVDAQFADDSSDTGRPVVIGGRPSYNFV